MTTFDRTETWVFDLDNTLYPGASNLLGQVRDRMTDFIVAYLNVSPDYARHLQKSYWHRYGTTLAGLMEIHDLEPTDFLDFVHDIDLSPISSHPELRTAIEALPGRKLIFTAGSRKHAENVAGRLGILDAFEDIMDIVATDFVPKERAEAYHKLLDRHGVASETAAMFEDMPHNLLPAHALGMTTVLVHSGETDHPIQRQIAGWTKPPPHIHHMTDDLCMFLETTRAELSGR